MLVLTNDQVSSLLSFDEVIISVEAALVANESGAAIAPQRMHVDYGNNSMLCMPAIGANYISTKLVTVVPGNREKHLPLINTVLLLSDKEHGTPLALMNAGNLTALRTGALGAVGLRYTTPADIDSIGLIGLGVQGFQQAVFACSVRPLKVMYVLKRKEEAFQQFSRFVNRHFPKIKIVSCKTAEEILESTRVLIAATTSVTPVIPGDTALLTGKHFIGIGSYKPTMQEFPDEVYRLAGNLLIDSDAARYETGDIINPVKKGIIETENVFTLGKLITGERKINVEDTTVYKSAGMALYDLFLAEALYEKALEKNAGTYVDL